MHMYNASRRCFVVAFLFCLFVAVLKAFPLQTPCSTSLADHQPRAQPNWRHTRDITSMPANTTSATATATYAVLCAYPVSGIYTRMQRLLYYAAVAFVLLLRAHEWLVAVGFTFILTYSSAACIHAILLSVLKEVGPDSDILALQAIVGTACLAGWCYSLCSPRILKHNVAPLFYIWTLFSLSTYILVCETSNGLTGNLANFIVRAHCRIDGKCNVDACSNATSRALFRDGTDQLLPEVLEQWSSYNATSGAWLTDFPNSTKQVDSHLVSSNTSTIFNPPYPGVSTFTLPVSFLWFIYGIIITFGSIGFLNINCPPSTSRNALFAFLVRAQILGLRRTIKATQCRKERGSGATKSPTCLPEEDYSNKPNLSDRQRDFARLLASCWFIYAWIGRILLPALPFVFVVASEWALMDLPESEAPWLVGQWAPFIYVGLALVVAPIMKLITSLRCSAPNEPFFLYPVMRDPESARLFHMFPGTSMMRYIFGLLCEPWSIVKESLLSWRPPVGISWEDREDIMKQRRGISDALRRSRRMRRQAKIRRSRNASHSDDDEASDDPDRKPVESLEFDEIWKRLSDSVDKTHINTDTFTHNSCTFDMCRIDNQGQRLADTGWIVASYEAEEYEQFSTTDIKRRLSDRRKRTEAAERTAESLEAFLQDALEAGGFELK